MDKWAEAWNVLIFPSVTSPTEFPLVSQEVPLEQIVWPPRDSICILNPCLLKGQGFPFLSAHPDDRYPKQNAKFAMQEEEMMS